MAILNERLRIVLILYAEIATWLIRAAIFTFWLSGALGGNIFEDTNGYVQGFLPQSLLLIIGGLTMNFALMGLPRTKSTTNIFSKIIIGNYNLTSLQGLLTLFQGTKSKNVIRNIAYLSGLKQVSKSADGSTLIIEEAQSPNKKIIFTTISALFIGLLILFFAPLLMYIIFFTTKKLFFESLPSDVIHNIITYFSLFIIGYFTFPYTTRPKSYLDNSVRYFSKPLKVSFGYPVFTSPLVSFLKPNVTCIALADPQGRVFIDTEYSHNNIYLDFLIAHEIGHLSDRTFNISKKIVSPILLPWVIFILFAVGSYNASLEYVLSGKLLIVSGLVFLYLLIFFWPQYIKQAEYRADDYAIKLIGSSATEKALEELSLSHRTIQNTTSFSELSFEARLERIREK